VAEPAVTAPDRGARPAVRVLAVGRDDPRHAALVRAAEAELVRRYGDGSLEPPEAGGPDPAPASTTLATLLAVGDDGAPLGCVVLATLPVVGDGVGEVKRLFVPPEARRRGVAAALLGAAVDAGRAAGLDALRLVTGTLQPEAIALYEREGWRPAPPYAWADDPMTRTFGRPLR
jgi:putative acetyltransferase